VTDEWPSSRARRVLPVIAVGGGLAGAAFAIELARHGVRVIILESSRVPRHMVCGEFLSEEAQILLRQLGLDPQRRGANSISRFRLGTGEHHAVTPLPFAAVALSRYRLDEMLLEAAAQAGAEVVRGARVTRIEPGTGTVIVREADRLWHAIAVGLATGKHSMRGFPRPPSPIVGFKMHLQPASTRHDLAGTVQLVFFRGGYVGACLVEDGILSLAWILPDHTVRTVGSGWKEQRDHLARQSSRIGDLLAGARPMIERPVAVAAIPYGYLRRQLIAPNIYPVGDQLAVIPSFTGDGIAIALYSGVAAARAFLAGQQADTWQPPMIQRLKPQFRLAHGIGRLLDTPLICGMSIAMAKLMPSLVRGVAAATRLRGFDIAASHAAAAPLYGEDGHKSTATK
jgi:menaquinone-9 beta-reductase